MQEENRLCYICSPYRGRCGEKCQIRQGTHAPRAGRGVCAGHSTPLSDAGAGRKRSGQREIEMAAGLSMLKQCRYILIGSRYGISEGMLREIRAAIECRLFELVREKNGLAVVYGET